MDYDFTAIEAKWQKYWDEHQTFRATDDTTKKKLYVLDMFPYPSGAGLHVGHPEGYTATDIYSRFKRMNGFNVLHPMGWDAFGLPAEQFAIETGTHPSVTTAKNIANFKRQIKMLGFSYDWSREINTTDPKYFRWTQWIFLQLYKKGLAYIDEVPVNWCPALGTVLANEEVIDGRSERGNHPVIRRPMKQWVLKITAYAERLLADLDGLDWPEGIKEMQRNWIGRSEGAEVVFQLDGHPGKTLTVFTTRPDTLFGATYMVLCPEHELVDEITTSEHAEEVAAYKKRTASMSDLERTGLNNEKTGAFTGAYAIDPVNGARIPIWISDYVLASYGTGAIMAVPAHDDRDFAFAQKFNIPVICVIRPDEVAAAKEKIDVEGVLAGKVCWIGDGPLMNSANADGLSLNGLRVNEAKKRIIDWLESKGIGKRTVNYKLRDWLFSRQRYWGEPFPIIIMDSGEIRMVPEDELPLTLPDMKDFKPSGNGESPLANATDWVDYVDPKTGEHGRRETNTMPQWAGSCWYYLRYIDPHNDKAFVDPAKEKYWMPVDLYVGGAEHAVLHLLYARFWHKVLYDLGLVSTKEPFQKLVNQGMILGTSYKDARGALVPTNLVDLTGPEPKHKETGEKLVEFPAKMSKSLRNVVNPDDVVREYGADSMRLYEMFMGPLEAVKPWNTRGVEGVFRFLKRSWRMIMQTPVVDEPVPANLRRLLHATIKKVTEDTDTLNFNTAISQMMIFLNDFSKLEKMPREAAETFVLLLAPYAPHIAEEMWEGLGKQAPVSLAQWPSVDESHLQVEEHEILVQICGTPKVRIMMPASLSADEMGKKALENPEVAAALAGKTVVKVIAVPGRLVNIVAK